MTKEERQERKETLERIMTEANNGLKNLEASETEKNDFETDYMVKKINQSCKRLCAAADRLQAALEVGDINPTTGTPARSDPQKSFYGLTSDEKIKHIMGQGKEYLGDFSMDVNYNSSKDEHVAKLSFHECDNAQEHFTYIIRDKDLDSCLNKVYNHICFFVKLLDNYCPVTLLRFTAHDGRIAYGVAKRYRPDTWFDSCALDIDRVFDSNFRAGDVWYADELNSFIEDNTAIEILAKL